MTNEINYPKTTTYYIANGSGEISYGKIEPDQCMTTGLQNVEQFTDRDTWVDRLLVLGIVLEEPSL